jgi:hypothetical protein
MFLPLLKIVKIVAALYFLMRSACNIRLSDSRLVDTLGTYYIHFIANYLKIYNLQKFIIIAKLTFYTIRYATVLGVYYLNISTST